MSRWRRHADAGGRRGKRRQGLATKLTTKLTTRLAEGSIVYGQINATERVRGEGRQKKSGAPEALSLRLAERGKMCFFPLEQAEGLCEGEVVRAKLLKKGKVFYAQALESLGRFDGDVSFLSALSLRQLSVRTEFSTETLSETENLKGYVYAGEREDLRTLDFVTIDGAHARDFDDAVHAEQREGGGGGWLVRVAIADVAHYVREGSRLDEEARWRGNSRYLADRVVPMLPPRLSEDLCSLREGELRPCVMAEIVLDAAGGLLRCRFARVAIRVSARLTYERVQEILDKRERGEETNKDGAQAVLRLYGAWRVLAQARRERGALDIVREEHVARLEREGAGELRCVGVSARMPSDSHRIIEDMMILANVAVAEHLSREGMRFVARAHEPPSAEKWQGLEKDLSTLGLSSLLGEGEAEKRAKAEETEGLRSRLRAVLAGVVTREQPVPFLASEAVLRAQSQARYAHGEDREHFALALGCYCHFTSPIRRYADLCVHRALLESLELEQESGEREGEREGEEEARREGLPSESSSLCESLVENERSAVLLERVVFQRMVCACLAAREKNGRDRRKAVAGEVVAGEVVAGEVAGEAVAGEVFEGLVVKVMGFGFFVRLTRWGIEGVVMRGSLARYRYARAREEAEVEGVRMAFGSRVRVRVKESDAVSGRLELSLA